VSLEELLAQADIVSLHCPREPQHAEDDRCEGVRPHEEGRDLHHHRPRRHPRRARADRGAALRPPVRAGIDVWDTEPPPLDHPLLAMDNVFASFHIAGVTHEARRNVAAIAAEQIAGLAAGVRPPRW
jgi:D-3-phosphoglycerate dehydrogenase